MCKREKEKELLIRIIFFCFRYNSGVVYLYAASLFWRTLDCLVSVRTRLQLACGAAFVREHELTFNV